MPGEAVQWRSYGNDVVGNVHIPDLKDTLLCVSLVHFNHLFSGHFFAPRYLIMQL
jgi:hypothetical protein